MSLQMQLQPLNYALLSACSILRDCFVAAVCCFHSVGQKNWVTSGPHLGLPVHSTQHVSQSQRHLRVFHSVSGQMNQPQVAGSM